MVHPKDLAAWVKAYEALKENDLLTALELYETISHLSRVAFNMASIYIQLDELELAIEYLTKAISSDNVIQ